MLDLAAAFSNPYQIKLFDGTVLNLKRPTQALQNSIIQLQKIGETEKDAAVLLTETMKILRRVLNRNQEGVEFSQEDIDESYDFSVALLVISDYFKYYNKEIAEKVNFQIAQ